MGPATTSPAPASRHRRSPRASCCSPTAPTPADWQVPEAAEAALAAGVPVSTIAYGTPDGIIDIGMGRLVAVPVDEVSLEELATTTGGQAYTAGTGSELAQVYEDIGSSIGWRTEPREVGGYVTAGALLLAFAAALLSLRWFARLP